MSSQMAHTNATDWIDVFEADIAGGAWIGPSLGYRQPRPAAQKNTTEAMVRRLGRLRDGWAGAGTKAPTERTLNDVEIFLSCLPSKRREPELEVDQDDGSVTMRWISNDSSRSISAVFAGLGHVVIVYSALPPEKSKGFKFKISAESRIIRNLQQEGASDLIR
jgi:hypothetical protein